QRWTLRYDANGQLVYLRDPENNVNEYGYDGLGNLVTVVENGTTSAVYTYNALSWKLSEKNPETKAEQYTYDKNGSVKTFQDKNGVLFNYQYSPFYEMTKVSAGNGFYEERTYDPLAGSLLTETNNYGQTVRYSYDEFRRLNNQTMMGKDYQLVHTDQDDAIDALIYPSRSAVSGSAPSMRVDYSYDSADRLSSVTIPSVGTTTYTYDIKSSGETNTVSYPGQPNAMQKTMSSFAEITGINHADGWSETNGYDLFGNITSQKRGGAIYGTFAYDKLSRIKEETIQGNTRQYAYDRRGNRQAYANAPADSTRSYELKHDLFNRLTEYKDDKGTTTYTYYPGGLRATKQQTGAVTDTTHYVYLNGQVIEELTQDGRVKARNVFGNQLIWRKDYTTNQEGTYYYNSHGDVVKIKGPSGNALNTYEYDIWGNLIADKVKETMPNPFAYAGEMYDKESGFYYLRARYYDPKMGRFISEDTVKGQVDNPLSLNRYTYVSNNPLKYVDPSGHINVGVGEGNSGTYYYFDNEGVRRIHGTKGIDWNYYREWFDKDQGGMHDALRGTNKTKNYIAAKVTWDWAMENNIPMDGGGISFSGKLSGTKLSTTNTVTNTKGTTIQGNFMPENYTGKNLPSFVSPGTNFLPKYDSNGVLKQVKFYDQYGREAGWVDLTNHNRPNDHTAPHWHKVDYNSKTPENGIQINYRNDPNPPKDWMNIVNLLIDK
ncbi:RHS repeat-associated core domain-containing protein, partial [Brevibacillus parabrevis]|uniref:RHS repeat-associated core domain-containing protein n=1 Tax=Brevibacillus parabrevis TaxID=54914 RepID=UPI003D1A72E1